MGFLMGLTNLTMENHHFNHGFLMALSIKKGHPQHLPLFRSIPNSFQGAQDCTCLGGGQLTGAHMAYTLYINVLLMFVINLYKSYHYLVGGV